MIAHYNLLMNKCAIFVKTIKNKKPAAMSAG